MCPPLIYIPSTGGGPSIWKIPSTRPRISGIVSHVKTQHADLGVRYTEFKLFFRHCANWCKTFDISSYIWGLIFPVYVKKTYTHTHTYKHVMDTPEKKNKEEKLAILFRKYNAKLP